ncbi:MAG: class II aldolase/adducin family protein [Burkholderiales bacterium]|nr:class II aldolase/adducin family protein [Burkholderiales bacterium]
MSAARLEEVVADLVAANRILARHGVLDGFGHVSARHPDDPARYLLSRSRAPELVEAGDIMVFDLDSNALGGDARTPYLERFIHGEIYRARPDVHAVVHSHSPSVIPFAASSVRLRPIYHMSGFLSGATRVFDIRHRFGCTDMLVRNRDHGAALAAELGDAGAVLMRGHGFVACGLSIPVAVYRAVYTEKNADLQQRAIALGGEVTYLDEDEARLAEATNRGVVGRPWELWKRQVQDGA